QRSLLLLTSAPVPCPLVLGLAHQLTPARLAEALGHPGVDTGDLQACCVAVLGPLLFVRHRVRWACVGHAPGGARCAAGSWGVSALLPRSCTPPRLSDL